MKKIKGFIIFSCFIFIILFLSSFNKKPNEKFVQTETEKTEKITETEKTEKITETEKTEKITETENYKIVYENNPIKEYSTLEEKIYDVEFQKGRKNLLMQMGIIIVDKNEKDFDYTSMKEEMTEEEKNKYEEIIIKGYADGYHKASENFYCPRRDY